MLSVMSVSAVMTVHLLGIAFAGLDALPVLAGNGRGFDGPRRSHGDANFARPGRAQYNASDNDRFGRRESDNDRFGRQGSYQEGGPSPRHPLDRHDTG